MRLAFQRGFAPTMVDVYTDGSCLNNPGPGGWGAVVLEEGGPLRLSGGEPQTTNNRMELTAAIKSLEAIPEGTSVDLHSDSEYLVKTMTRHWKRRVNTDLWDRLDTLAASHQVRWHWVQGHAGNEWNEEADRLAGLAMNAAAGVGNPSGGPVTGGPATGSRLTHVDAQGRASMVDVGAKPDTQRTATAQAVVSMRPETLALILQGQIEKGDVFTVARIAGISAAKRTWDLVPLAHQIPLSYVGVEFQSDPGKGTVTITTTARTTYKTGVEMEALTAASVSALSIYDMCKAVDRAMTVREVRLLEKRGGQGGDYQG